MSELNAGGVGTDRPSRPDQCPKCGLPFRRQDPSPRPAGFPKEYPVTFEHAGGARCCVAAGKVPWFAYREPVYESAPTPTTGPVDQSPRLRSKDPRLDAILRAVVDRHMADMMRELEESGMPAVGVVVGVLHGDETSASWCVSDKAIGADGKSASDVEVARHIAADVARITRG